MNEDLLCTITLRLPYSMASQLATLSGKNKPFKDKSDCGRTMISRGLQVEALMKIYNDPHKKTEFESKLSALVKNKNIAEVGETMLVGEIESAIFVLTNIKNKKIQQLILEV